MRVKPSRGAVIFYALVVLGIVAHFGWDRHERQVVAEDAPPAILARRVLRCVAGRDAQRILAERPADWARWAPLLTDRLRRIVGDAWSPEWPSRCVPLAERLAAHAATIPAARAVAEHAATVAALLSAVAPDRVRTVLSVDNGQLGNELAQLAFAVSGLSTGAEEGWLSPIRDAPTDLWPVNTLAFPRVAPLAESLEYPTLALPDLVLYQDPATRMLHQATFDAHEHVHDRTLGPGAPTRDAWRDGEARITSDDADSLFLSEGEPATLAPLPDALRDGAMGLGAWQTALTDANFWLLTEAGGVLTVHCAPRAGPLRWRTPVATIGEPDTTLGGTIAPDPSGGERVVVHSVRRGARGISIDRADVSLVDETPTLGDATAEVVPESPIFAPRVNVCASGTRRYILVSGDAGLAVFGDLDRPIAAPVHYRDFGTAPGDANDFSCNDEGALLFASRRSGRPTLVAFEGSALLAPRVVDPPPDGENARIVGAARVRGGGVVVLVQNDDALRSFRQNAAASSDGAATWSGGALLALDRPAPLRARPTDGDTTRVLGASAQGDQVAVLVDVHAGTLRYVGRIASRDRGDHWRGAE